MSRFSSFRDRSWSPAGWALQAPAAAASHPPAVAVGRGPADLRSPALCAFQLVGVLERFVSPKLLDQEATGMP